MAVTGIEANSNENQLLKTNNMRTIKFRGKRIDNGEWIYGDLVQSNNQLNHKTIIWPIETSITENMKGVHPETVGQFTGLLDKNGVEIYEGDIIQLGQSYIKPITVYWNNEMTGFYPLLSERPNNIEVIGNIHETPE